MPRTDRPAGRARRIVAASLALALGVVLTVAALDLPRAPSPLADRVAARAGETGATNPVTAVLLGFRAYDTWLEVAVVLAAVIGVRAVVGARDVADRPRPPADPLLGWMVGGVVPAAVVTGGFLLWAGTSAPGGAFQAGSVLGAAALLLWLSGDRSIAALPPRALSALIAAGAGAFTIAAAVPLLAGGAPLEIPPGAATAIVIAIESAVTLAVAVSLPLVVIASRAGAVAR